MTFKQEEGKAAALRALPRAFLRRVLLKREHRLRAKCVHAAQWGSLCVGADRGERE